MILNKNEHNSFFPEVMISKIWSNLIPQSIVKSKIVFIKFKLYLFIYTYAFSPLGPLHTDLARLHLANQHKPSSTGCARPVGRNSTVARLYLSHWSRMFHAVSSMLDGNAANRIFPSSMACRAWLIYDITDVFVYEMLLFGYLLRKGVIAMVFNKYVNKIYEWKSLKR